jgi:hypothetical protein
MPASCLGGYADYGRLQQGFAIGEMGLGVTLQGSNSGSLMSVSLIGLLRVKRFVGAPLLA